MTGYHISIGYLSDYDKDEAWSVLKMVVLDLCHNPHHLVDEAVRLGMLPQIASMYAAAYTGASRENAGTGDSTLRIIEGSEDSPPQIMMLASGTGESRLIKEAMRRAFCRVLMREMHKLEIEINVNVA